MQNYKLAGFRIIGFSDKSKAALKQVSQRLMPYQKRILESWVDQQWNAWEPPGFTRDDLRHVFGEMQATIMGCMASEELEFCIDNLERLGGDLAQRQFPFEALIISIHFFEESYLPFLLNPPSDQTQVWLIAIDEFLHAALAAVASAYFQAHRKELLEQAEVGRVVQEGLLADIPRSSSDLEIAHVYISAHESAKLGGDFLDFFTMDSGGAAFLIGDLSGHGLEAAADSVMLRSLFRGFMRENPDVADAMSRLNKVLDGELDFDQFATALAVNYERSGRMQIVNAGHPYPVLCNSGKCTLFELSDAALALHDSMSYRVGEVELGAGGVFVVFTDGLIESKNANDELFGEERVARAVSEVHQNSARAIAEHLIDQSLRHGGGRFSDDVAVLVLKRAGGGE